MSLFNLDALVAPVSDAAPAGANLEYEPEFRALEEAAIGKREQQMGSGTIPGEPPNFNVLFTQSLALLERSKDLRIAGHLTRAAVEKYGFSGLHEGFGLIRRLLEKHWGALHPQLDPDDGNDPTMRISALSALISPEFMAALRSAPLLVTQVAGPISLRLFAIASGELPQPTDGPKVDTSLLDAGFREVPLATVQGLAAALDGARAELKALAAAFQAGAGAAGPDFSTLDRVLHQAQTLVRPRLAARNAAQAGAQGAAAGAEGNSANGGANGVDAAAAAPPAAPLSGSIRSRDDVVMLLDKICGYYERNEPSSPLPLLLARCRKLATLSFIDIVKDMAPGALQQVEVIAGTKTEPQKK
jgi:type VI secretion system protein ImpA